MANPGLSPEILEAMKRRQMGAPAPALNQTSPGAAMSQPLPPPMPQSEMTQASAPSGPPTGQPAQTPKFQAQDRKDLIVQALVEQLDNDNKLDKEKSKMATAQPSPMPEAPMGGGMPYAYQKPMGGGNFSMSPGYEQPMPVNQMQGDYESGMGKDYSGMNNYGQGDKMY